MHEKQKMLGDVGLTEKIVYKIEFKCMVTGGGDLPK